MNGADTSWFSSPPPSSSMTRPSPSSTAGLVRSKNALNTMMMSFVSLGFVGVAWALLGYSLAFGPGRRSSEACRTPFCAASASKSLPRPDDPPPSLHGVPGDVCDHHGGPDLGRHRRAKALLGLCRVHHPLVPLRLFPVAHWVWGGGFLSSSAPSTSPAERSYTSTPAWRPSSPR